MYVPGGTALRRFDAAGFKEKYGFYLIKKLKTLNRYLVLAVLSSLLVHSSSAVKRFMILNYKEELEMIEDLSVLAINFRKMYLTFF